MLRRSLHYYSDNVFAWQSEKRRHSVGLNLGVTSFESSIKYERANKIMLLKIIDVIVK